MVISNLIEVSNIITNKNDEELINSWISPNNIVKYKRIYRATKDGDKASDFHRLCDDKGPILIIGKTPGGYIFGGFTKVKWNMDQKYIEDIDAFVFSLNQRKYFKTKSKNSIVYIKECGPIFGENFKAIEIKDNILTNQKHWSNPINSYGNNLKLTENNNFSLNELEAFLVQY